MAAWSVFMADVVPHVPGAPDPLVHRALCAASREFCAKTFAWKEWIACALSSGSLYTFTAPSGSEVLRFEQVTRAGEPVEIVPLGIHDRDWEVEGDDEPEGATTDDLVSFTITGGAAAGDVRAHVALQPTREAAVIGDFIAKQYHDAIVNGAVARLLEIKGAPWRDLNEAKLYRGHFLTGIDEATTEVFHGFTRATPRARITWC